MHDLVAQEASRLPEQSPFYELFCLLAMKYVVLLRSLSTDLELVDIHLFAFEAAVHDKPRRRYRYGVILDARRDKNICHMSPNSG